MSEEGGTDPPPEDAPQEDGAEGEGEEGEQGIAERIAKDPIELEFLVPLPEQIQFEEMPRVDGSRQTWREGMMKVEAAFGEHMSKMHQDFEEKTQAWQGVQTQLETNFSFLETFYIDMQKLLNEKWASIKVEKDAWEQEKEDISKLVKLDSEIVNMNIGGDKKIQTEKSVLRQVEGSMLQKYFSDMHELKVNEEGEVFLDRDPTTFENLINYLRSDCRIFPAFETKNEQNMFINELYHWGIDPHNKGWQEAYLQKLGMNVIKKIDENIGMSKNMNNAAGYPMNNRPPPGMASNGVGQESMQPIMTPTMSPPMEPPVVQQPLNQSQQNMDIGARGPSLDAGLGPQANGLQKQREIQLKEQQQINSYRPMYGTQQQQNQYNQFDQSSQQKPQFNQNDSFQKQMAGLNQQPQPQPTSQFNQQYQQMQSPSPYQQSPSPYQAQSPSPYQQAPSQYPPPAQQVIQPSPMYQGYNKIDESFKQSVKSNNPNETPPFLQEDRIGREPVMHSGQQQKQQPPQPVYQSDTEVPPGVALPVVKSKWTNLGPLKLEDIIANSSEQINQGLQFGQSKHNKYIIGQVGVDGRVQGVGKEINHIIYEGQFKNDIYHGYGRHIYSNGNYYIGNWVDGKRSGWGKLVDQSGKVYEGMWKYSKFIGQ